MATSAEKIKEARAKEYGALIGGNAVFRGVDQGIDFVGKGPVYALGAGQVTRLQESGSGWPGEGALLVYNVTGGALKGKSVYVAEDFNPAAELVKAFASGGSVSVEQGQVLGYATGSGLAPGIEVGYSDPSGRAVEPLLPHGSTYPAGGQGYRFNQDVKTLSAGGDLAKLADMFKTSPSSLQDKGPVQSGLEHVPGVTQAEQAVSIFKDTAGFFEWFGNKKNLQRVGEMLGGSVLILAGIVMVGRAASSAGPVQQVQGAAKTVAAPVRRSAPASRPRTSTRATAPISQSSARTRRRAGFTLPADQRRPKRGTPRSSRLAKGDSVPF